MITPHRANPEQSMAMTVSASEAQMTRLVVDNLMKIAKDFRIVARAQIIQTPGVIALEKGLDDIGSHFRRCLCNGILKVDFPIPFFCLFIFTRPFPLTDDVLTRICTY